MRTEIEIGKLQKIEPRAAKKWKTRNQELFIDPPVVILKKLKTENAHLLYHRNEIDTSLRCSQIF